MTYHSSEFAKMRVSLAHEFDREEGKTLSKRHSISTSICLFLRVIPPMCFKNFYPILSFTNLAFSKLMS